MKPSNMLSLTNAVHQLLLFLCLKHCHLVFFSRIRNQILKSGMQWTC